MTVERAEAKCASYLHYLIIAGGQNPEVGIASRSIEILDTKSVQWFKVSSLLFNKAGHPSIRSITIIGEISCIFSFTRHLTSRLVQPATRYLWKISLPLLISHTLQGKDLDTSIWEKIPDLIGLRRRTVISIGNMLLTAGGCSEGFFAARPHADIYLFNPHMNEWVKIGELPEPRYSCACAVLPSGKLLVAGGQGDYNSLLPTVYTATISGSYFEPVRF